jgi:two-component system, cell cycle sensor histidine kinase and response regulator CckA
MKSEVTFGLENAGWAAFLVDGASGSVIRSNPAATRAFDVPAEDNAPLSAIWSPENGTGAKEFLAHWEKTPASTITLKLRIKGGNVATFMTSICCFTQDGNKYYLLQMLPEPERLADNGALHKQKLDCALQLARSVALDFNNALTSILGYTSLLLSKAEANHPWRRPLLELEKSASRAAEIASDLAAFSRQEKEVRAQSSGNLNTLLQRGVELFQHSQKTQAVWQLQLEKRLLAARFDEAKIQQAFMKILENAVEALGENGRITVQTRNMKLAEPTQDLNVQLVPGDYVCTEISDNGHGIEAAVLPRIFEPFFSTKKGPHRGLGLAWVYGIVTNHGGGVAVSSTPGSGTSVRVYLPAEKSIVRDGADFANDLTGNQTILMVDDEDLLLTMGETILSTYGYKVLTANTGQKALDIFSKTDGPIDLVITDLVMPTMSGRELAEQIRRIAPDTKILCSSGYVWPSSQQNEAGFLQKPFTTQELLRKVKRALVKDPVLVDS